MEKMHKIGEIKNYNTAKSFSSKEYIDLINQYTRTPLDENSVYVFPLTLCNNDVDRDNEQFTLLALYKLAELFVGKTGITDHNPDVDNQIARIVKTTVDAVTGKKNKLGEDFYNLNAIAYMVKSDKNKDFIMDIDAGIKKEVSVGCAVSKYICSICGENYSRCEHQSGKSYDGKTCFVKLDDPVDAYEFSFVAVPSQKDAGVTKKYDKTTGGKSNMEQYNDLLKEYNITEEDFKKVNDNKDNPISANTFKSCIDLYKTKNPIDNSEKVNKEDMDNLKVEMEGYKKKAESFDKLFKSTIDSALVEGLRAKGDNFDKSRWEKILNNFELEEIIAQKDEWHGEAENVLNAGGRKSEPTSFTNKFCNRKPDDYKF